MLGIGFWEMLVIAGLILVAVGPDRLPAMVKTVAKFYRQFRRTAEDLRASTGIDDILRDEELKELAELRKHKLELLANKGAAKPLASGALPAGKPQPAPAKSAPAASNPAEGKPLGGPPASTAPTHPAMPAIGDRAPHTDGLAAEDPGHAMLGAAVPRTRASAVMRGGLDDKERAMEVPPEGVDVFEARRLEPEVTEDELRLRKARIAAKNTGRSVDEILAEEAARAQAQTVATGAS